MLRSWLRPEVLQRLADHSKCIQQNARLIKVGAAIRVAKSGHALIAVAKQADHRIFLITYEGSGVFGEGAAAFDGPFADPFPAFVSSWLGDDCCGNSEFFS